MCRAQQSLAGARVAAASAAVERQAVLAAAAAPPSGANVRARAEATRRREGGGTAQAAPGAGAQGGIPHWRTIPRKKALGKLAENTLEMMFARTQVGRFVSSSSLVLPSPEVVGVRTQAGRCAGCCLCERVSAWAGGWAVENPIACGSALLWVGAPHQPSC